MFGLESPELIALAALIGISLLLWLAVRVLRKAGFSGWWSLLLLVPFLNVLMLYSFAYLPWPRIDPKVD